MLDEMLLDNAVVIIGSTDDGFFYSVNEDAEYMTAFDMALIQSIKRMEDVDYMEALAKEYMADNPDAYEYIH